MCSGCASIAPAAPQLAEQNTVTPVMLDASQIFTLYSAINKQEYRIRVRLPENYATNPAKKYPVIIKVDGQWDFLLAASTYNCLYFDGQMPETIVIGIDWANVTGNIHAIRARDLLPQPNENFPNSGHAKTFVDVIAKDIIPELNNRFRLNGQHFLLGGSWGGLFVSYALMEQPEIFEGAIAIGGDYESGGEIIHQQLQKLAGSNRLDGKRLYIGAGKWDAAAPKILDYVADVEKAKLTGLQLKLDYLDGYGHSGMNVPGYGAGYQFMFQRPKLSLKQDALQPFVGRYKPMDNSAGDLIVSQQPEGLTATRNDTTVVFWAKSNNSFYHPGMFFNLTFEGNQAQVETFYGVTRFQKIKSN